MFNLLTRSSRSSSIATAVSLLIVRVIGPFTRCKSLAHNLHVLMKIFEYVGFQIFNTEGARNFGFFFFRILHLRLQLLKLNKTSSK